MCDDIHSESTSTIGDDWVNGGDTSLLTNDNKNMISSFSVEPQPKQADSKNIRWARLLGVVNRPNPLEDWDHLYNLNNQSGLRNDCRRLAKSLDNKKSVPELESFMTLYCKKRNIDYEKGSGWIVVLEKLLKLEIASELLFNVFFTFTTKYIPKETREGAQIYDLFRLLLQYHDPQLSSHLDSLKCSPYSYANDWFSTVLACSIDDNACRSLWDYYIEKGDPFLVFYMSLVLIINARECLIEFSYDKREKALMMLRNLPTQLSEEDVSDFVQLAVYYGERTPQSVREEFNYLIFGSNYDNNVGEMQVSRHLCLPVTVQELTRRDRGSVPLSNITYFVIDCRSHEAYMNGHIYGSFNLDCQLFVDSPLQFEMAMGSLESFKNEQKFEDHICFIGFGEEDLDKFMHMIIARFLRDGKRHISFVQGGYKALHSVLLGSNRLRYINSHKEKECTECCRKNVGKSWNLVIKMKEAVLTKSAAVKGKVSTLVTSPHTVSNEIKHIAAEDRHGKRYRNEPSVFSLDDDSSEEDGSIFGKAELILADHAEFIEHFECHEIVDDKQMYKSQIALTRTHIHILRDVNDKPGHVTTEARHALSTVLRVTSKKKVPELLTFKFGYEINGESKITSVHRFLVPKAGECAKSVKTAIFALRPLSEVLDV